MRIGLLLLDVARSMQEIGAEVQQLEAAGLESATLGEAYSFDAVSQLGYLAARTKRIELATGILPLYSRTPTLLAMTAAGIDYVSDGRFRLGIGASGPQVIEGFHGVEYDAPLSRMREVMAVCRAVWRREKLVHQGLHYQVPLPDGQGSGEGKPLKLINHPVRDAIPISVAGTGLRTVALAAEAAEYWEPIFFHPASAERVWGAALAEGKARRDPALGPLGIVVRAPVAIGENVAPLERAVRAQLALYVGGMGSRQRNFYKDLACRYGFEAEAEEIQELFLAGRAEDAADAVPQELVDGTSLVGTEAEVERRLSAFAAAGATMVNIIPLQRDPGALLRDVSTLLEMAQGVTGTAPAIEGARS
jgi:F420-dependent oxidoreductase-like protein